MRKQIFKVVQPLCLALLVAACNLKKAQVEQNNVETAKFAVKNGEITNVSGNREISGIYPHLTTYAHGRANGGLSTWK